MTQDPRTAESMPHIPAWNAMFVRECCETDRMAEARDALAAMCARGLEVPVDWVWPATMSQLAEVCAYLQDADVAAVVYSQLAPVADQVGTIVVLLLCYGSQHFPAGLLATCLRRWTEAERHFEAALATNERLEARPWVVRTRRGWAAMLLDRDAPGDRERAAELIAAGRVEAEQLGMAARARALRAAHTALGHVATWYCAGVLAESCIDSPPSTEGCYQSATILTEPDVISRNAFPPGTLEITPKIT